MFNVLSGCHKKFECLQIGLPRLVSMGRRPGNHSESYFLVYAVMDGVRGGGWSGVGRNPRPEQ